MTIDFSPTIKQDLLWEHFHDDATMEILYGGSAGSGKSIIICALTILKCLENPGIRVGISRLELTTLKKTTLISFFEVCDMFNLKRDIHYSYNSVEGVIKFRNGSEIVLIELRKKPSDPNYTRLGGLLLTFVVVDELGDIPYEGYDILSTRVGRWMNEETGIKPIMISTSNPVKTWVYNYFYKRKKNNTLPPHVRFIQALPTDNPYLPEEYINSLKRKDKITVERLLKGNWEYSESDLLLFDYDKIIDFIEYYNTSTDETYERIETDIHSTIGSKIKKNKRYLSVDVARLGKDKTVMWVMNEYLEILDFCEMGTSKVNETVDKIKEMQKKWDIPASYVSIDSDGVGGGVVDYIPGCKSIVNNSRPIGVKDINYQNLKTQLIHILSEKINTNMIKCLVSLPTQTKEMISQELSLIERVKIEKEGKYQITSKEEIKSKLSRSPDYLDSLCYLMYFELKIPKNDPQLFGF